MSLRRDTAYNLFGNAIPLIAAVFAIPYLLTRLGNEGFGLLALIWALIGYFGLFDLGIGRALTYEVSRRRPIDADDVLNRCIKAGLTLTLITGVIGGLLVLFLVAPFSATWFKIGSELRADAQIAFGIVALAIIPTTLTSGLRGVLEGYGRFYESNITKIAIGTLMFVLPVVAVANQGVELKTIAIYLVLGRYLVCAFAIYQIRKNLFNTIKFNIRDVLPLLNFGVWVTISGLVSPLMVYGDRFFVSAAVGVQSLPLYAIPQEGLQRMLLIPAALVAALMPRMTIIKDVSKLREMYAKNLSRIAIIMLPVCVISALAADPILTHWISSDFARKTISIVYVLCLGLWFNSMAQLSLTLLYAVGQPKLVAITHLLELVLYIALIAVLSQELGIFGAALAWSIRVTIDLMLLHFFVKKHLTKARRIEKAIVDRHD